VQEPGFLRQGRIRSSKKAGFLSPISTFYKGDVEILILLCYLFINLQGKITKVHFSLIASRNFL